jgi:histidinol dehydrogenase
MTDVENMTAHKETMTMPVYEGERARNWIESNLGQGRGPNVDQSAGRGKSFNSGKNEKVLQTVSEIIATVGSDGDAGLNAIAMRLGDKAPQKVILDAAAIASLEGRLPAETKAVLTAAAANIRRFGQAVVSAFTNVSLDFGEYSAGFEMRPVRRAACYIPGGRYPLPSTALMTAITASVAGVQNICIVSPKLCDEILYAGTLAGVSEFHQIGGAQAVAAMALGTETIEAADLIVGPGNAYVTEAKRQLFGKVGIDMLAGPSEVAIIADSGAKPKWLALDLLAQAEHDPDSRVYLLTDCKQIAQDVAALMPGLIKTLAGLPDYIGSVLAASAIIVLPSLSDCARVSDLIAPEHLELQVAAALDIKKLVTNYGALFMGYTATVPFGDYVAGPNHTLPTNRSARFAGGLSPLTFMRGQSWLDVKDGAVGLASTTAAFAAIEGLLAHEAAARARLE